MTGGILDPGPWPSPIPRHQTFHDEERFPLNAVEIAIPELTITTEEGTKIRVTGITMKPEHAADASLIERKDTEIGIYSDMSPNPVSHYSVNQVFLLELCGILKPSESGAMYRVEVVSE